jgi:hypothetical protein
VSQLSTVLDPTLAYNIAIGNFLFYDKKYSKPPRILRLHHHSLSAFNRYFENTFFARKDVLSSLAEKYVVSQARRD